MSSEIKMAETKLFTRAELKVKKNKDTLFVIHNRVYDVTSFLDTHPGGEEVFLETAGTDNSEMFEDVGHSSDARETMKKYMVGEVVQEDRIEQQYKPRTFQQIPEEVTKVSVEVNQINSSSTSWLLPLVLAILAILIYREFFD